MHKLKSKELQSKKVKSSTPLSSSQKSSVPFRRVFEPSNGSFHHLGLHLHYFPHPFFRSMNTVRGLRKVVYGAGKFSKDASAARRTRQRRLRDRERCGTNGLIYFPDAGRASALPSLPEADNGDIQETQRCKQRALKC